MGHGLQLTCLWLLLLHVFVADAATFSSIGHTTPTRLAEQATTVFLWTPDQSGYSTGSRKFGLYSHMVWMFLLHQTFVRSETSPLGCKVTNAADTLCVCWTPCADYFILFAQIQNAFPLFDNEAGHTFLSQSLLKCSNMKWKTRQWKIGPPPHTWKDWGHLNTRYICTLNIRYLAFCFVFLGCEISVLCKEEVSSGTLTHTKKKHPEFINTLSENAAI